MADLALGVLGILCVWFRGNFWLATAIALNICFLGDAIGHARQVIEYNNQAAYNSGVFLYAEIVTPLIILVLTFITVARPD